MDDLLREQAEYCLGVNVAPAEWGRAKAYAERKLAFIIQREGDAGGLRRELQYLVQLIVETVRANALTSILNQLAALQ